jgi:2-polyprenyl-3-methyl-5-hydroxy-6-metoxy-1,4-benzoquinol methylase
MCMTPLGERNLQPELMDAPDLDPRSHAQALVALRRVNVLSRTAAVVWSAIRPLARSQPDRPLRVLDVASGGGDVTLGIWRRAQREGLPLEITGLDMSAVAVAEARSLALAERAEVEFRVGNVVDAPLPADFDVIVTSLFLHHLTRADAVRLLAAMSQTARRLVVVSDLRRSTAGYLLAQAVCRLITRSPVVHVDGPRSVAGAFTMAEMRQMCVEADLTPIRLVRCWPCRFLLSWERA